MDALGGYSDSDDDDSHKETPTNHILGGLLANYSDEDDEYNSKCSKEVKDSSSPDKKRAKITGVKNNVGPVTSLPPPTLLCDSFSTPFMSLFEFNKNYTKILPDTPSNYNTNESTTSTSSNEKLNELYQSLTSSSESKSFASHLQSKKDFHNPHMFPSIISHFNIDARASNIRKDIWDPHGFQNFEYIDRLVISEEQSRMDAIKQQQKNQQAPH